MDNKKTLTVRMTGGEAMAAAMERWEEITKPLSEQIAEQFLPAVKLTEDAGRLADMAAKSVAVDMSKIEGLLSGPAGLTPPMVRLPTPDTRNLPEPWLIQAERDAAMLEALQAIRGHLEQAEEAQRRDRPWNLTVRVFAIIGVIATVIGTIVTVAVLT